MGVYAILKPKSMSNEDNPSPRAQVSIYFHFFFLKEKINYLLFIQVELCEMVMRLIKIFPFI